MIQQRTDDWFKDRLGKFTASKIHLLYSVGKSGKMTQGLETYIYEKVVEEMTQHWEETDSPAMKWGRTMEPKAIGIFELYHNKIVSEAPFVLHPDYKQHSGGSPEGLVDGESAIIEVKCPYNSVNHIRYLSCRTPEDFFKETKEYMCQIQWNCEVTESELGYFISYDPRLLDSPLHVLEIPRDEDIISSIKAGLDMAIEKKMAILKEFSDTWE